MTMHINLLDWRQAKRERVKKQFGAMVGAAAAAGAVLIGFWWFAVQGQIADQRSRNEYLDSEIKDADRKILEIEDLEKLKSNLLARMKVIEELGASRTATVYFFDEIVNTLPDGINLTSIKQQGTTVTIAGTAEANGNVSSYMKNLDASPWFAAPQLKEIATSDKNGLRRGDFSLQVTNLTKATAEASETQKGPQ